MLDKVQVHECDYNWKTFIEVYLEDYHVGPFHPGLGGFVSCDDLAWEFGRHHSVQTVGVQKALERPGSPVYQRWHDELLSTATAVRPQAGAIWLTYYPTSWSSGHPHVLVVSTLHPQGPQKRRSTRRVLLPREIAAFERRVVEPIRRPIWKPAWRRRDRRTHGRRPSALFAAATTKPAPTKARMEDGMQHFHEWYRSEIVIAL